MEQNYSDNSPRRSIVQRLEEEVIDARWYERLMVNTRVYIKVTASNNYDSADLSQGETLGDSDACNILRKVDRTRNTGLILQYLLYCVSKLPLEEDIKDDPINPFEQLKSFALSQIGLLREIDVIQAILKEYEQFHQWDDSKAGHYLEQIDKNYNAFTESVHRSEKANLDGYRQLFRTLQQFCVYWFSVCNEDIDHVRKSYILIYKLVRLLLAKYPDSNENKNKDSRAGAGSRA
ncbi:MAG: hypothetical protein GY940_25365 [bacterium]|nr:hypothetical protein [bacterium]